MSKMLCYKIVKYKQAQLVRLCQIFDIENIEILNI